MQETYPPPHSKCSLCRGGVTHLRSEGYPIPGLGGVPHLRFKGVPVQGAGGIPSQVWGVTPSQVQGDPIPGLGGTLSHVQGGTLSQVWGDPILTWSGGTLGISPVQTWDGVPPSPEPDMEWGTPQPDLGWGTPPTWYGVFPQTWLGYPPPRDVNWETNWKQYLPPSFGCGR